MHFMDRVGEAVAVTHAILAPLCPARTVDLILPILDEAEWIGQEPKAPTPAA